MPVSWIEYKNKKIIYSDYSNQSGEQILNTLKEVEAFYLKLDKQKKYLSLSTFEGSHVSQDFMKVSKEIGKETFEPRILKGALIGITGVKKVLLKAYNLFSNSDLTPFDTEEQAKEWLIK